MARAFKLTFGFIGVVLLAVAWYLGGVNTPAPSAD